MPTGKAETGFETHALLGTLGGLRYHALPPDDELEELEEEELEKELEDEELDEEELEDEFEEELEEELDEEELLELAASVSSLSCFDAHPTSCG